MTPNQLHEKAFFISRDLKEKYLELFEVLLEIDRRQIFLGFDVTCLKVYCVELLELSPATAKDFVTVVKKSIEIPVLAEAVRSKKVSIYKARKICPVLTAENAWEWIELASECSTRIIEKTVAMTKPREAVYESMTYVSGDVLEFKLAVSQQWEALLKQTKDLMSQKQNRAVTSEEALLDLMQIYCERNDPVKKAERAMKRSTKPNREQERRTRYRMAKVEHEVNLRDQGQCTHVHNTGKRCEAKRWLHKHHVVEFANGGEHAAKNLVTLCGAHHRMQHRCGGVT